MKSRRYAYGLRISNKATVAEKALILAIFILMKKSLLLTCFFIILVCYQSFSQVVMNFNHVALAVKDLDKSAEFYQRVLELDEIVNRTENPERRWFSLGEGKELHLILDREVTVLDNMGVHMAVTTPDFDNFLENVRSSGTDYFDWSGKPETVSVRADGIRQIYIKDPDGYWIEINSVAVE